MSTNDTEHQHTGPWVRQGVDGRDYCQTCGPDWPGRERFPGGVYETPDTERDERLRQLAALLLRHGHAEWDEFDAQTVASVVMEDWAAPILAEVTRLDAVVTAVRDLREEYFDEDGHTEPEDVWRLHRDLGRVLDGGAA